MAKSLRKYSLGDVMDVTYSIKSGYNLRFVLNKMILYGIFEGLVDVKERYQHSHALEECNN